MRSFAPKRMTIGRLSRDTEEQFLKMLLKIAPIDAALLSLVQLVQPASIGRIFEEAQGTIVLKILKTDDINQHLERLEKDRFLLRTENDCFIVAPKSYELLTR